MSRKVSAVLTGWLAAASIGLAQSGQPNSPAVDKGRSMSPYYPTASTVDRSGELPVAAPPEMPNIPVPRAPAPVRTVGGTQPMPAAPVRPVAGTQPTPAAPVRPVAGAQPTAPVPARVVVGVPQPTPPVPTPTPATPAPAAVPVKPPASLPAIQATPAPAVTAQTPAAAGAARAPVVPSAPAACDTCGTAACTTCSPCGPTGPCGPQGRVWASGEYLLWWMDGMHVPALVTGSPAGTPRSRGGVLGYSSTAVLFGNDDVGDSTSSGFRARAGFWLDDCRSCGLESSFLYLKQDDTSYFTGSDGLPIIARPFSNASPPPPGALVTVFPVPDSEIINFPGLLAGGVSVATSTELYGFDANFRKNLRCGCNNRIDGVVGYRYLRLTDDVTITENLSVTSSATPALPLGTSFLIQDGFETDNEFHGAQVGIVGEWRRGRWFLTSRSTIALGNTHSEVNISGFSQVAVPGGAVTQTAGGLLTQQTNLGSYSNNQFSFVPESTMTVGYQVTGGIRAFAGYSALYWSNVTRAGEQIDLVVNTTQIPPGTLSGSARPANPNKQTDFWAQGFTFGVEVRY